MIFIREAEEDVTVLEFQGSFENLDLFDGQFDRDTLVMTFKDFTLQGKLVKKDFTVFEKVGDELRKLKEVCEVVYFGQPPRFRLHK